MKFSMAWASIAAQNVTLKAGIATLGVVTLALAVTTVKLALKPPLVIERGCLAARARLAPPNDHSPQEIESFLRDAIVQRFNSDAASVPGTLSFEEESARAQEQKELLSRGMTQKVTINSIKAASDTVAIDADRLISVGTIRSAFPFPLTATLYSVTRTEANPYGLILTKIGPQKTEAGK